MHKDYVIRAMNYFCEFSDEKEYLIIFSKASI